MTETPTTSRTSDAPDASGFGKPYFIKVAKQILLDQHLRPGTSDEGGDIKLTRHEVGVREGQILTYLDVILNTDGDPAYDVEPETLRVMLLGQALTEHVQR